MLGTVTISNTRIKNIKNLNLEGKGVFFKFFCLFMILVMGMLVVPFRGLNLWIGTAYGAKT